MRRPVSRELRQFRVKRYATPDATAFHLRGSCAARHVVTYENTVSVGSAGYRCRLCRQKAANDFNASRKRTELEDSDHRTSTMARKSALD